MQMQFNANDFCYGRAEDDNGIHYMLGMHRSAAPDKFELYEIIREKQNDEESKSSEPRKYGNGKLEVGYEDLIGSGV